MYRLVSSLASSKGKRHILSVALQIIIDTEQAGRASDCGVRGRGGERTLLASESGVFTSQGIYTRYEALPS